MKEEDMDWVVYHELPEGAPITTDDLAAKCGFALSDIVASLARLERSCLVECCGSSVRMLSYGEALVRNQLKHEDLPFTIENGIIREKKRTP